MVLVGHANGSDLAVKKRFRGEGETMIHDVDACNEVFVAVGLVNTGIWKRTIGETMPFTRIANGDDEFRNVAVSKDLIVMGGKYCKIRVYRIRGGYNMLSEIYLCEFHHTQLDTTWIEHISFLNADIVMVTTGDAGIFFLSLSTARFISHFQIENPHRLLRATLLSDGRVCVGGQHGYCAILQPPHEIEGFVNIFKRCTRVLFAIRRKEKMEQRYRFHSRKVDYRKRRSTRFRRWLERIRTDGKINLSDIELVRKPNGDRKRIGKGGTGDVYLGRLKMRDENDNIIAGQHMEVAVKEIMEPPSSASTRLLEFMREVLLQRDAQHPCIVRTMGGYWPDPEERGDEDGPQSCFNIMELMTCNLYHVQYKQLLESHEMKRRILGDVAEGVARLHNQGIVHRDLKPQNVLMRLVDGQIFGRAKICDFGISRNAQPTPTVTTQRKAAFTHYSGPDMFTSLRSSFPPVQRAPVFTRWPRPLR